MIRNSGLIALVLVSCTFTGYSQGDFSYLKKLSEEDSNAINALILYPKETRDAMLEASLYPESLVRLQSLQAESSESFTDLMSPLSKDDQEKFWDIVRYQGLVGRLAEGKRKSESEIRDILKDYPDEIHQTALSLGTKQYETLVKINEQEKQFHHGFESLISQYPLQTQQALSTLVAVPEVLSILQDNISLVVLVGDAYRKNPEFIKHQTDSLSLEAARQNAEDTKQWSKSLEDNPQATEELKESAEEYARDYGYDENDYMKPRDADVVVVHHYYDYPYPYWCGWPYWYPPYWWYPYPYWYHWGFYFSDGGIIVCGLPSYFFVSWYFHYPIHHYYYPHLSDAYIHMHHHGPRRVGNTVSHAVNDWEKDEGDQLPPGLLKEDPQRVERLKEYGKFEEEYARHNVEKPDKPLSRDEFYKKNEKKFPELNFPQQKTPTIKKEFPDDLYQKKPYPTKKEIEKKTYDGKWVYPEKKVPDRQFYPDKQLPSRKQIEPQRKVYPQNNPQPEKKFIPQREVAPQKQITPQKQVVPQKQVPQRQLQPKSNNISKPK